MALIDIVFANDPVTGFPTFDASGYPIISLTANVGANTYGALQAKIQNEILGSPTTAQIQNAIGDAIANFESMAFWFNQIRYWGGTAGSLSNLQTTAGQELYSGLDLPILAVMPAISNIQVIAFGNRYSLRSRTKQWMDENSVSPTWQGLPTDYTIVDGTSVRLYPIPNAVYPLIVYGTTRFPPLVNSPDFNCWTNRGEALIRQEAKRLLFLNITRNPTQVQAMEAEIYGDGPKQGILSRLRREGQTRLGTGGGGKIRASRGYM